MKVLDFKYFLAILTILMIIPVGFSSNTYNSDGDFSVFVESQEDTVLNQDINSNFQFTVKNLKSYSQSFEIKAPNQKGWSVDISSRYFTLAPNQEKEVDILFASNSEFDYTPNVVSPNIIKITHQDEYIGFFEFPVTIKGVNENISLKYDLNIERPETLTPVFEPKLSTDKLSPVLPLRYTLTGNNLINDQKIFVRLELGNEILSEFIDTFTPANNYKIYEKQITKDFEPGTYDVRVTVRILSDDGKSATEWFEVENLEIVDYKDVTGIETRSNSLFKDTHKITIVNNGNVKDEYVKNVEIGFFESMLFGTNNEDFFKTENGIKYVVDLERGETKEIIYSFNYIALYVLIFVILILVSYFYVRRTSNPLDIETKIYEIKKVEHEGVKSLKLRIGFENIKNKEINDLRIVFRMPSYLQVEEGSFLLVEPKHVLKGKDQFKLIWDFKNFEENDSRIVGFQLVNKKGVLGDIKIPDIEFDVKIDGKQRKYYASFPVIRG